MGDTNNIKDNKGFCVTADLVFANKLTIEKWISDLLQMLKSHPETSSYFVTDSTSNYEVNMLPLSLIDTSAVETDKLSEKRNFASERALYEAKLYSAKFYPVDNQESLGFYKKFQQTFVSNLINAFNSSDEKGTVKILSQFSFLRLSYAFVNFLLMRKPDGTPNIKRRFKVNPEKTTFDESGNPIYSYYTEEDVIEAESKMTSEMSAQRLTLLDVDYVPRSVENSLISIISYLSVGRPDGFDLESILEKTKSEHIETFFEELGEGENDFILQKYSEYNNFMKADLGRINLVEDRYASGDILSLIKHDCSGMQLDEPNMRNLTMTEKYIGIMSYLPIIFQLIDVVVSFLEQNINNNLSKNFDSIVNSTRIVDGEEMPSLIEEFNSILFNENFKEYVSGLKFVYTISTHTFMFLCQNILKQSVVSYGDNGERMWFYFKNSVFSHKSSIYKDGFDSLFGNVYKRNLPRAIEDIQGLEVLFKGGQESLVSYAYRNVEKYIKPDGTFKPEIGIIVSSTQILISKSNGRRKVEPKSPLPANSTFDVDCLIRTVSSIMSNNTYNDSYYPFDEYKREIKAVEENFENLSLSIKNKIDSIYGQTFSAYVFDLPPLPFNQSEKLWAKNKCDFIEEQIKAVTMYNSTFDWVQFRSVYFELLNLSQQYSKLEYEDPLLSAKIRMIEERFDELCQESDITSDSLDKIKDLLKKLDFYTNLDKIRGNFVPFDFKLKTDLGNEMKFHLSKAYIIHNGYFTPITKIVKLPGYKDILVDYFKPYFLPFATINIEKFDIKFTVEESEFESKGTLSKRTVVIMTVVFGSSTDVHICSKFRTRFPCIADTKTLIKFAKEYAGVQPHVEFEVSDVSDDLIIKWDRTGLHVKFSGNNRYSVIELIASSKGAYEQYPAYDSKMMKLVKDFFDAQNVRYLNDINLQRNRIARELQLKNKPVVEAKFEDLGKVSQEVEQMRNESKARWAVYSRNEKGESLKDETITGKGPMSMDPRAKNLPTGPSSVRAPFGKKPTTDSSNTRVPFGKKKATATETPQEQNFGEKKGGLVIKDSHEVQQIARETTTLVKVTDSEGFTRYEKRSVTRYEKKIINVVERRPNEPNKQRFNQTPSRFRNGVVNRGDRSNTPHRRGNSPHASSYHQRTSSPHATYQRGKSPHASFHQRSSSPQRASSNSPYQRSNSPYRSNALSPRNAGGVNFASSNSPVALAQNFDYFQGDNSSRQVDNFVFGNSISPNQNSQGLFSSPSQTGGLLEERQVPSDILVEARGDSSKTGTPSASSLNQSSTFVINDDDYDI